VKFIKPNFIQVDTPGYLYHLVLKIRYIIARFSPITKLKILILAKAMPAFFALYLKKFYANPICHFKVEMVLAELNKKLLDFG